MDNWLFETAMFDWHYHAMQNRWYAYYPGLTSENSKPILWIDDEHWTHDNIIAAETKYINAYASAYYGIGPKDGEAGYL